MLRKCKVVSLFNTSKQIDLTHAFSLPADRNQCTHVRGLVSISCVQHIFKHMDCLVCPCFMFLITGCFASEKTGKGVAWVICSFVASLLFQDGRSLNE